MSSLVAAFKQSQKRVNARPAKPSGNIILKPSKFTDKSVIGEVMTGPAAGQEIEVAVPNNGPRTVGIKQFTTPSKATTSSYVDIANGGTIRIERLREGADGAYTARWMNVFDGRPDEGNTIIYDAVVQLRSSPAKVAGEADKITLHALFPTMVKAAATMLELEERVAEAFAEKGGAHIFFRENGEVGSFSYPLSGTMTPDGWVANDPKERAAFVMGSFGDDRPLIEKAIAEHPFSVVPSQMITVGKSTADEIGNAIADARRKGEEPRISTIDPSTFLLRRTGLRVAYALNENPEVSGLPKDAGEKLRARFLEVSDEQAKEAFLSKKSGWAGVSDDDMRRFFESQGAELTKYPDAGWSRQSILLKRNVATKAFGQPDALPFPPLEICKEVSDRYVSEIRDVIRAIVDAPAVKAKAETTAPVTAAAAPAPSVLDNPDINDLDDLLNGIDDEQMGV